MHSSERPWCWVDTVRGFGGTRQPETIHVNRRHSARQDLLKKISYADAEHVTRRTTCIMPTSDIYALIKATIGGPR